MKIGYLITSKMLVSGDSSRRISFELILLNYDILQLAFIFVHCRIQKWPPSPPTPQALHTICRMPFELLNSCRLAVTIPPLWRVFDLHSLENVWCMLRASSILCVFSPIFEFLLCIAFFALLGWTVYYVRHR